MWQYHAVIFGFHFRSFIIILDLDSSIRSVDHLSSFRSTIAVMYNLQLNNLILLFVAGAVSSSSNKVSLLRSFYP